MVITVVEKFTKGGWLTLAVTGACVGLCLWIHGYYDRVNRRLRKLDETLRGITTPTTPPNTAEPNPSHATAAILVGGYSGIGIHTMMNTVRFAPGYYRNMVFISVGVADSGNFKGAEAVDDLRQHTEESLHKYVELARQFGFPATSFMRVGTDAVDELEKLCLAVAKQFPRVTIFAGQLVFQRDAWYQRLLHNFTAFALQRRLQWAGLPMVILPTRVR